MRREFAFQEITYTDDNSQKLKYVGTLEVEGGGAFEEEFVDTLFDPSKKEVQFILDNNEIHYMDFGEEGPAVEFGERSQGDVHESIRNVKCKIFSEKREFKYRPRAAFHHVREQKIHFTNMDDETFHNYFDIISKTWICSRRGHDTDGEIVFYKEQNTMLSKLPISRLFFHDGVRAELDNDRIKIREINFRSLDGLTSLKYSELEISQHKIREFDYLLDITKLYSIALKGDGAALEVGSRWQEQVTINSTDGFDYADPTFT
ncbi:hypothetical protein LSTR_LSTR009268 [Laodelphax striatellus]|uniref:Uncharacterized protein n=1 Tax=Laodelphax striatellus TaxID=195883 RepID=A0A482X4Y3_LAOST|nr:hypothetical protein LSTR_LSTR009268 [Laodelphax striatellus]